MIRFLTAGESHGEGLAIIVEGVPAGLLLSEEYIGARLARRQRGYGRGGRMLIEQDQAHIMSGVRHGLTLGSPIALTIENKDWVNWQEDMSISPIDKKTSRITRLRPGHADLPGTMKYGFDDVRNVLERASARETAARVAAGFCGTPTARGIRSTSQQPTSSASEECGPTPTAPINWEEVEESPVRCADSEAGQRMMATIDEAKESGDTVGGVVEVIATDVPIGLGSHVHWDRRLDGRIAQALMSINAVKGASIGDGWESVNVRGSQVHDVISPISDPSHPWQRLTNRSGGTEGE